MGLAVVGQGLPVAVAAFLLLVALTFDLADADEVAVLVALLLAVAVPDAVAVLVAEAVPVEEELALSLGLTLVLPLAGLSLVPAAGAVCEPAGVTLGVCDLLAFGLAAADDEEADGHAVAFALLRLADELARPAPPFAELAALPEPARLGGRPLALDEEIPTADPSWTKASRSGGSARTTPMANTAQAAARAGLSSPSRQSRGRCRGWPLPPRADPRSPRPAFRRPVRPARKPPSAAERPVAWADRDRTRARIRSRPSGCGSTWSAAACSARRR